MYMAPIGWPLSLDIDTFMITQNNTKKVLFHRQQQAFKIDISYGLLLRDISTNDYRYFHSSAINYSLLDSPILIWLNAWVNAMTKIKIATELIIQFQWVFDLLKIKLQHVNQLEPWSTAIHPLSRIIQQSNEYITQIPVLGFNSWFTCNAKVSYLLSA